MGKPLPTSIELQDLRRFGITEEEAQRDRTGASKGPAVSSEGVGS